MPSNLIISSKKKEMAAAAAFSSFPEEIQAEILVKLPAKSVLTCKCVCKLWLNLISSPRFTNDHLHLSIQNKKNHKLMFTDKESVTGKPLLYSIDHASISSSSPDLSCDYIAEKVVLIDYPFEYKDGMEIRILGACNGLICFGILMDTNTSICIWNPTTREYKEIQHCDFHINPKQVSRAGFGFDAKTGDYKMVRIGDYEQYNGCCKVEVYTFGLHLSKTVLTFGYMYPHEIALRGVFLNGALHWIGSMFSQVNSNCIVSFDVSNEKLMDVALPENSIVHPKDGNSKSFKQVGILDECLSLVLIDEKMVRAEVWVMQEYGVRESWTKLFTTTQETLSRYSFFYTPMLSLENGEILMYTCDGFVLCDPKNDRVGKVSSFFQENTIGNRGITMMMAHPESYVESLVSLNSGTYAKKPN